MRKTILILLIGFLPYILPSQKIIKDTTTYSMQNFEDASFWDRNDQQYSLNELSGKVVFIDFWGTWCAPCSQAIPESESLLKKINVPEFEFISIDTDAKKWEKFLLEKSPAGIHIQISDDRNHPIRKMLTSKIRSGKGIIEMLTIPQYYLVQPDGTFEKMVPPNTKTKKRIPSLLTKAHQTK